MTFKSALFATAFAAVVAAPAFAEDLPELNVALAVLDANFNVTTASIFRLADELGYFEKHGVKVNYITLDGTPQAVAALHSGAVDLADIGIDAAIRLRADNGVAVKGFVSSSMGTSFLVASKDDIKTFEDLKGRAFAIADNGSLDHSLTQAFARNAEMAADDINYVAIGAPDVRVQALAAGRVDATTVSFGTYSSIAGTPGIHVLVSPEDFAKNAPAMGKFVAGLETTLNEKRDAIERFTTAMIDVSRAMEASPETWVEKAAAARDDLTREALEVTVSRLAGRWCVNGCFSQDNLEGSVDFIYNNPDFAGVDVLPATEFVDYSFTEKALETLGVYTGEGLDAR